MRCWVFGISKHGWPLICATFYQTQDFGLCMHGSFLAIIAVIITILYFLFSNFFFFFLISFGFFFLSLVKIINTTITILLIFNINWLNSFNLRAREKVDISIGSSRLTGLAGWLVSWPCANHGLACAREHHVIVVLYLERETKLFYA